MTDDAPFVPPEEKPWPPREGLNFFLLWCAGLIVESALSRAVGYFGSPRATAFLITSLMISWSLVASLGAAWQGWLIFPQKVRIVLWALIPFLGWWGQVGGQFGWWGQLWARRWGGLVFFESATIIAQLLLLRGVRMRWWLWLIAAVLHSAFHFGLGRMLGQPVKQMGNWIAEALPLFTRTMASGALWSGVFLLSTVIGGAILAWWMPPLARSGRRDGSANTAPTDD